MERNEAFAVLSQIHMILFGHFSPFYPTPLSRQICSQQANQVFTDYSHERRLFVSVLASRSDLWKKTFLQCNLNNQKRSYLPK